MRMSVDIPIIGNWKPSKERSTIILNSLLTNVYRSFELRDENDLYDRLAISVYGDQLTKIYLENRNSLEFENRGGARARGARRGPGKKIFKRCDLMLTGILRHSLNRPK